MADFCYACTPDPYKARNDFVHGGDPYWALCEGCGIHLFRTTGKRACGRGQSEFHHAPAFPDPCEDCIECENA